MTEGTDGYFTANYGRVGYPSKTEKHPMSKWESKVKEKLKKGYVDVTNYKTVQSTDFSFTNPSVQEFYLTFKRYTAEVVNKNYINGDIVTKAMIDDAQDILNSLVNKQDNNELLKLFTVIPRKMKDVKSFLFTTSNVQERIQEEQMLIDSLSANIASIATNNVSFQDHFGITIEEETNDTVTSLINKTNSSRYKIYKVFKVTHNLRQKLFDDYVEKAINKNTELLIHGTRNQNVFNILNSGLIIRPSNVYISGAVYGHGIYHSAHADKSLNYTGNDNDKLFFIQNVHTGNKYQYNGWYRTGKGLDSSNMNYDYLNPRGYDSLYVKAGDGLQNSEYIVYNQNQTTIAYIVWLK